MSRLVAALLGLLCTASLASAQWPRQGLSRADRDLYARLMMLGDTRTIDTTVIDEALSSRTNTVRAYGLLTLGQLGHTRAWRFTRPAWRGHGRGYAGANSSGVMVGDGPPAESGPPEGSVVRACRMVTSRSSGSSARTYKPGGR
jgi:hypothetical protein